MVWMMGVSLSAPSAAHALDRPTVASWWFHDTVAARLVVGLSPSVAGPIEWNSLPHSLRDPVHPVRSTDGFRSALKTHLFVAQRDDLRIRGTA